MLQYFSGTSKSILPSALLLETLRSMSHKLSSLFGSIHQRGKFCRKAIDSNSTILLPSELLLLRSLTAILYKYLTSFCMTFSLAALNSFLTASSMRSVVLHKLATFPVTQTSSDAVFVVPESLKRLSRSVVTSWSSSTLVVKDLNVENGENLPSPASLSLASVSRIFVSKTDDTFRSRVSCFEGVQLLIFVASLSEFDQVRLAFDCTLSRKH